MIVDKTLAELAETWVRYRFNHRRGFSVDPVVLLLVLLLATGAAAVVGLVEP